MDFSFLFLSAARSLAAVSSGLGFRTQPVFRFPIRLTGLDCPEAG